MRSACHAVAVVNELQNQLLLNGAPYSIQFMFLEKSVTVDYQKWSPLGAVADREDVSEIGAAGSLQLRQTNGKLRSVTVSGGFGGRCFDLDSRKVPILVLDNKNVIAYVNLRQCGIISAQKKLAHHQKLASASDIKIAPISQDFLIGQGSTQARPCRPPDRRTRPRPLSEGRSLGGR